MSRKGELDCVCEAPPQKRTHSKVSLTKEFFMTEPPNIQRWIGLDIHKAYFVAVGVDAKKQTVFGPQKITND
jgi:hypothetical protein